MTKIMNCKSIVSTMFTQSRKGGVNMNFFVRQFYIKEPLYSTVLAIKWWESKRFIFNIFNLVSLLLGILIVYFFNRSLLNFFLIPFILSYGILINVVYLLGWIILGIIKKTWIDLDITVLSSIMLIIFLCYPFLQPWL
jgi:hypothetical protein